MMTSKTQSKPTSGELAAPEYAIMFKTAVDNLAVVGLLTIKKAVDSSEEEFMVIVLTKGRWSDDLELLP